MGASKFQPGIMKPRDLELRGVPCFHSSGADTAVIGHLLLPSLPQLGVVSQHLPSVNRLEPVHGHNLQAGFHLTAMRGILSRVASSRRPCLGTCRSLAIVANKVRSKQALKMLLVAAVVVVVVVVVVAAAAAAKVN